MQVQSVNNQNKNINFSGLYKIPAKGIGETVSTLLSAYLFFHMQISKPISCVFKCKYRILYQSDTFIL